MTLYLRALGGALANKREAPFKKMNLLPFLNEPIPGAIPPSTLEKILQVIVAGAASIGATIGELRARDVKVSDASPVGANLQAFLSDPAGNLIELHQAG